MKHRIRLALFFLAIAAWMLAATNLNPSARHSATPNFDLATARDNYTIYNEMWFDDKLPKDTVIGITHDDALIGVTTFENGHYVIRINPKYNQAGSQAQETILHESCHIRTWDQGFDHGSSWQSCMLGLALQGAFRNIW